MRIPTRLRAGGLALWAGVVLAAGCGTALAQDETSSSFPPELLRQLQEAATRARQGGPKPSQATAAAPSGRICSRPKEVSGHVELEAGCTYRQDFLITTSNTTLDCKGALIDGQGRIELGILIDSQGKPLSNVQVSNCVLRNFVRQAVRVAWERSNIHKPKDESERFRRTPSNVRLSKLDVGDTGSVGVYFDDYVRDSLLEDSRVAGSGGTAVYLEFGTRNIEVRNNLFERNGHAKRREGLAIDASSNNKVVGNTFADNTAGGIFLYKNCSEQFSKGRAEIRTTHSDDNFISQNRFVREKVGIWIASRQSRNLSKWDCGDRPMDRNRTYYEDFADRNTVQGNVFCATETAIRIEGDDNQVRGNYFDRQTRKRVEIPATKRGELLGRPPRGNRHDEGLDAGQRCSRAG